MGESKHGDVFKLRMNFLLRKFSSGKGKNLNSQAKSSKRRRVHWSVVKLKDQQSVKSIEFAACVVVEFLE